MPDNLLAIAPRFSSLQVISAFTLKPGDIKRCSVLLQNSQISTVVPSVPLFDFFDER